MYKLVLAFLLSFPITAGAYSEIHPDDGQLRSLTELEACLDAGAAAVSNDGDSIVCELDPTANWETTGEFSWFYEGVPNGVSIKINCNGAHIINTQEANDESALAIYVVTNPFPSEGLNSGIEYNKCIMDLHDPLDSFTGWAAISAPDSWTGGYIRIVESRIGDNSNSDGDIFTGDDFGDGDACFKFDNASSPFNSFLEIVDSKIKCRDVTTVDDIGFLYVSSVGSQFNGALNEAAGGNEADPAMILNAGTRINIQGGVLLIDRPIHLSAPEIYINTALQMQQGVSTGNESAYVFKIGNDIVTPSGIATPSAMFDLQVDRELNKNTMFLMSDLSVLNAQIHHGNSDTMFPVTVGPFFDAVVGTPTWAGPVCAVVRTKTNSCTPAATWLSTAAKSALNKGINDDGSPGSAHLWSCGAWVSFVGDGTSPGSGGTAGTDPCPTPF